VSIRSRTQALVVGGGPAGTSTAIALAREGIDVMLVDRARFPRPKPCAEYLSPEASRILHAMGALAAVESTGAAQLAGVLVRAPNGAMIHGEFLSGHGYTPFRQRGLSVRREVLDKVLIDAARESVEVHEGARVTGLSRRSDGGYDATLSLAGDKQQVRASMVIGADGLHSTVASRLGLTRAGRWPRRLALVSHFEGITGIGELAEMHVEPDGFVGIADVGHGLTTVALVVPATRARELSGRKEEFLDHWLRARPHLAPRFARARRVSPVQATGPFASHARRAWSDDALLVGDAADFFDPFTGEGIFAALRGGELAADAVAQALRGAPASRARALAAYDVTRRKAFGGKWVVERVIAAVVANPWLMNRAANTLSRRRDLADLLIGVTGDFVPAREVVNAKYVLSTFGVIGRPPVVDSALPG
jgi:2-polyprenyl-6-methoxyphenol hydroxylase-like FAD-dependent oxidoreductase